MNNPIQLRDVFCLDYGSSCNQSKNPVDNPAPLDAVFNNRRGAPGEKSRGRFFVSGEGRKRLISFERNRYSVPASFANRPVSLRIYPNRLVVAAEGNILCEHARLIQRSHDLPARTIYDWRHYLAVVQRKPGALRNGAPFLELPPAFRQLQDHMLRVVARHEELVQEDQKQGECRFHLAGLHHGL